MDFIDTDKSNNIFLDILINGVQIKCSIHGKKLQLMDGLLKWKPNEIQINRIQNFLSQKSKNMFITSKITVKHIY